MLHRDVAPSLREGQGQAEDSLKKPTPDPGGWPHLILDPISNLKPAVHTGPTVHKSLYSPRGLRLGSAIGFIQVSRCVRAGNRVRVRDIDRARHIHVV